MKDGDLHLVTAERFSALIAHLSGLGRFRRSASGEYIEHGTDGEPKPGAPRYRWVQTVDELDPAAASLIAIGRSPGVVATVKAAQARRIKVHRVR